MLVSELKKSIREVPDFPKPGISFKDVTTLFRDAAAFRSAMDRMTERFSGDKIDAVAGIDARGFVLAGVLADRLNTGLILVRKGGKLGWSDAEGEIVIPLEFDHVFCPNTDVRTAFGENGKAIVGKEDEYWVVSREGQVEPMDSSKLPRRFFGLAVFELELGDPIKLFSREAFE